MARPFAGDPYFADLDQTISRLRQSGIRPLVYLTPIDLDDVARFGGADVLAQLQPTSRSCARSAQRDGM